MSLYALPAVGAAVSALAYKHVWIDTKAVSSIVSSCSQTIRFAALNKTTLDSLAKGAICLRTSYLQQLFADKAGVGALMVYSSLLVPLFVKLSYHAGSPNNVTALQGPLLPTLALALTSMDALLLGRGVALVLPVLIASLYVAGSAAHKTTHRLSPVPTPAKAIYAANLTALAMSIFLIATMLYDLESYKYNYWWEKFVSPQVMSIFKPTREVIVDAVPLLLLPLLLSGYRGIKRVTTEDEAKKELGELWAEEVAYGFERTWAYYRQTGLLSFMSYIWGMSRIYRGVVVDKTMPSLQAQYVLLVSLLLLITLITTVVVDAQTTPERDDEDAIKAIARAPAGNPGVEDNIKVLLPLAVVAGPSLSAMLWFAHLEEIRGYKGRRAWRAKSAETKGQK